MANTCTGKEKPGRLEMLQEDGRTVDATIISSMCFGRWLIEEMGRGNPFNWYSCRWEGGVDPDDPATWPPPAPAA